MRSLAPSPSLLVSFANVLCIRLFSSTFSFITITLFMPASIIFWVVSASKTELAEAIISPSALITSLKSTLFVASSPAFNSNCSPVWKRAKICSFVS